MKTFFDNSKDWLYTSMFGRAVLNFAVKRAPTSKLVGRFADSRASRKLIPRFVKDYDIDINPETSSFVIPQRGFRTLNELFTRSYKHEFVDFPSDQNLLGSPAEGYLSLQQGISLDSVVQAKGFTYSLNELVGERVPFAFEGGLLMRVRLTPKEYHHFHYFDDGRIRKFREIPGFYYTAEDLALENVPKMFCKSYRHVTKAATDHFGSVYIIELGSNFVGSIVQTKQPYDRFKRGDEKGHFRLGGSTVILLFEKGIIELNPLIREKTQDGNEVYVSLGQEVGYKS
jgi:phosphatidylserine decarboxylase